MAAATTPFLGNACRILKNNVAVAYTDGWDVGFTTDMVDKTSQGDSAKTSLPSYIGGSGTIKGKFVPGNTECRAIHNACLAKTLLTDIKLQLNSVDNYYSGDCYISNFSVSSNSGANCTYSATLTTDGAWTLT